MKKDFILDKKVLTKIERESIILSTELKDIIVGLLLGDLTVQKNSMKNKNVILRFEQGIVHEAYLLYLYELFKDFCQTPPRLRERKIDSRTNKLYNNIRFSTRSLPCFYELYESFYKDGKKVIPLNIEELLTPAGLAHWAMDDGAKSSSGFIYSTCAFELSEVELLSKALENKFNLNTSIYVNKRNHPSIYIKSSSMVDFRNLVLTHFHDSMKYKLNNES